MEKLDRMKSGYAKDVAILQSGAVASILESGGFDKPVQFFRAARGRTTSTSWAAAS
jgi:tRNA (cmo5U34)-methyltransferase